MKLITWNIQWGCGVDGRVDLDRIVATAGAMADFDVLCLQEVAVGYPELQGADGRDQFAALAARLPGYTAVAGVATDAPGPHGDRRAFGNMILSCLPVLQVFRHLLPWPADPGRASMQRMALEVTLDAPAGPLRVLTTHLEYYSRVQRAAQVERLRDLQREAVSHARHPRAEGPERGPFAQLPRGGPAVLCGDFNCRPDVAERLRLLEAFGDDTPAWVDAWALAHPGQPHAPTVGVHDRVQWASPRTFDYMIVSDDLAPRVAGVHVDGATAASDHQPMLLTLHD